MEWTDPVLDVLLRQLDQAFDRRSWHGTNLLGSVRRLSAESAAWRPRPERHNIWEVVVHAAYWKYRAARLISDETPRFFSLSGSDWFERPVDITETAWKEDVRLLREWHDRLRDAVAGLDPAGLHEPVNSSHTRFTVITGAAAHDLYHAGQIQLLKRLRGG